MADLLREVCVGDESITRLANAALSDETKTEMLLRLGHDDALWVDGIVRPQEVFRWLSEHGGTNRTNAAMVLRILKWRDEQTVEWVDYLNKHGLDLERMTVETTLALRDMVPISWPRMIDSSSSSAMNHLYDRLRLAIARAETRWGIVELRHRSLELVAWSYIAAEADHRSDVQLGAMLSLIKPSQLPALIRFLHTPKSLELIAML
jgi:hypothetical protein